MYISGQTDNLNKALSAAKKNATPETQAFFDALADTVTALANEVDILSVKMDEISDKAENYETYMEHLSASLQSVRDCIVGDVKVDTDDYTSEYDQNHDSCGDGCDCCGGDCGHHHADADADEEDEGFEDFYTVHCPFCEECFFIEKSEYEEEAECPVCGHVVNVKENLIGE